LESGSRRDRGPERAPCGSPASIEVWEEIGWNVPEVEKIVLDSPSMAEFRQLLFSKIVPNVKRLGLLTPRLRKGFEELGIIRFEEYEPSA
jgi:hypothetical protein